MHQAHEGMNRYIHSSSSNSLKSRQPPSQAPATKSPISQRFHSRNSSDPQDYRRRPHLSRYDEEDTEDPEDEDEDDPEMTAYSPRSAVPNASSGSAGSRPGSSSKDSAPAIKKPKTKSTKVFQCTGYGDCTMQFTRSEHLARHIR